MLVSHIYLHSTSQFQNKADQSPALTLYHLRTYRLTVTSILLSSPTASSTSTTSVRRFRRLLYLGLVTQAFLLPSFIWSIINLIRVNMGPNTFEPVPSYSFSAIHGSSWNEIEINLLPITQTVTHIGVDILSISPMVQVLFSAGNVLMGVAVIAILGCGPDATRMYAAAWSWLLVHLGLQRRRTDANDSRVTSGRGSADWRATMTPSSSVFAGWRGSAGARVKRMWGSRSEGQMSRQSSDGDVELAMGEASPGSTVEKLDAVHLKDSGEVAEHGRGYGGV
jgi:hypothetical protein